MALIRIEEWTGGANGANARISFNGGSPYLMTVSDPFTPQQEQQLAWYFEQHLNKPFFKRVQAREAATSITAYGEALFQQVFKAVPDAYAVYKEHAKAGLHMLQFEIAGSSAFQALHWEALKDPQLPHPFALDATIVRRNLNPIHIEAIVRPSPTINILVVTARPDGRNDVGYRTISRPMVEALNQANVPVHIDLVRPGTYAALEQQLRTTTDAHGKGYYHVIHFDVHGAVLTYEELLKGREANRSVFQDRHGYDRPDIQSYAGERAFLFLELEPTGQADPVAATELAKLLLAHQIPVAMLNACQSGKEPRLSEENGDNGKHDTSDTGESSTNDAPQEQDIRESSLGYHLMQAGIQVVLAMSYSVTVSAAKILMQTLYRHLFSGDDLSIALRAARMALANSKARQAAFNYTIDLEDWLLPVVSQNQVVQLSVHPFTPEEEQRYYEQRALRWREPETTYGFFGRDLDVLEIERRLLTSPQRNILLVRGMGGAGKTTLLRHLAAWWQTTHLAEQVCYFGYDERAWNRQQLIRQIAEKLVGRERYKREFQALSQDAQQDKLTALLRATRHLLMLDNLESITGTHFAIRNTLSAKEQTALRRLLADLAGGKTLVLLGSRADEAWLAKGTFTDNIYELAGLDPEAASQLTECILERHHATKYREDKDLRRLLRLLDGFPLALEIVLTNLRHQTPTEVLTALQAGDIALDAEDGPDGKDKRDKTESILRCIEYSHSNLSPEAQQLLLCLAPFTLVIDKALLEPYTQYLKLHSVLADLPFDRWNDIVREAQHWGLLTQDKEISRFLHLQPVFPYFLQNRLSISEQEERRVAIEAAFCQLYREIGSSLQGLLDSKEPHERLMGQVIVRLEYENLLTALRLALQAQESILRLYLVLSKYLGMVQETQRGLELGQMMWIGLQTYPAELQAGLLGIEMASVLHYLAYWHLQLKQYGQAENAYQQGLAFLQKNTGSDADDIKKRSAALYHELGRVAQGQRKWEEAEQNYQQSLQIYEEYQDRYSQAVTYHNLGIVAQEQRKWEEAEQSYQQALQIKIECQDRYEQAGTYHQLGRVAEEQRKWEEAEQNYQQALQIYEEYQDRYSQASTYHQLGMVAQKQRKWEEAEQNYQQALQIKIECQDRYSQASTYGQLGIGAQEQKKWEEAIHYLLQALELFVEYQDWYSQASTYHQLGRVALRQRKWEEAEQNYQQALQIYEEYQDRYSQASTYHELGRVAQEQRKWEEAEQNYQQALQIYEEYQDRYSQASTYHELGRVAQEQRKWEEAEQNYQQALQIFVEYQDRYEQAGTYHQLGSVAQEQRKWEEAIHYLLRALELFVKYDNAYSTSIASCNLARLWRDSGDTELPAAIASMLKKTKDEVEQELRRLLEDGDASQESDG